MGGIHGHWWNARVWAEGWSFAADFFKELTELFVGAEKVCGKFSATYKGISGMLSRAGEKDLALPQPWSPGPDQARTRLPGLEK